MFAKTSICDRVVIGEPQKVADKYDHASPSDGASDRI